MGTRTLEDSVTWLHNLGFGRFSICCVGTPTLLYLIQSTALKIPCMKPSSPFNVESLPSLAFLARAKGKVSRQVPVGMRLVTDSIQPKSGRALFNSVLEKMSPADARYQQWSVKFSASGQVQASSPEISTASRPRARFQKTFKELEITHLVQKQMVAATR